MKQLVENIQDLDNILLLFKETFQKDKYPQQQDNTLIFTEDDSIKLRGLDFQDLTKSVCYDQYQNVDNYVHSIGRCGRQGQQCTHYILTENLSEQFYNILQQIGQIQLFESYNDYKDKMSIIDNMTQK